MSMTDKLHELHNLLWSVVKKLPSDYVPYGQRSRSYVSEDDNGVDDCSSTVNTSTCSKRCLKIGGYVQMR